MNKDDILIWQDFKENVRNKLTPEYRKILCELHAKYFNHRYYEPCTCNGKIYKQWINQLNKLYDK
jgi:hypothetical protein